MRSPLPMRAGVRVGWRSTLWLLVTVALAVVVTPAGGREPWRIGYLAQASPQLGSHTLGEFKRGMRDLGYVEGQHYAVEVRNAEGRPERLNHLAAELVASNVDVIVAASTPPTVAAMRATRSIPIVIGVSADPVGSGLVRSLARPGGNVTGTAVAFEEVSPKWLEFLAAVRSRLARVAVLSNSTNQSMPVMLGPLRTSARALNVSLTVHDLKPGTHVAAVLDAVRAEQPDGLVVLPDGVLRTHEKKVAELAERLRVPVVYGNGEFVLAGGLMSYGPDFRENFRRAATYTDKILKGASPADLPVERPRKFELIINLKTARTLGVAIPPALLGRADRVVE